MVSCGFRMKSKLGDPCRDCSLNNVSIQKTEKSEGVSIARCFPSGGKGPVPWLTLSDGCAVQITSAKDFRSRAKNTAPTANTTPPTI